MILIDRHKLLEQLDEHLRQLDSDVFNEVTTIKDDEGITLHVPTQVCYLVFKDEHDMATRLNHALECAIVETETREE